ncbi:unnamed protein product [Rhizoctonia solani]|uniref:Uncharacterized protein n=1 Tax=Rhizoctonia solani TaxID=456999 RepID=A0A8H3ATE8_9AGAM|nr:unnamed protein product [Rhizoctonia solani]
MVGDTDQILDLTDWGSTADGTKIYSVPRAKHVSPTKHMAWQFWYISDETGEESSSLTLVQRTVNVQFTEIKLLREFLLISRQEVAKLTSQMEGSQLLPRVCP